MDNQEIRETAIWKLFEKGRDYHRRTGIYTDTDRNYRMYNGDQWAGAKLGDVEPIQKNFIMPIVKYKVAVIHANLYAINFSSGNYESRKFRTVAERVCKMLNRFAGNCWEQSRMDYKGRRLTMDAAINDEGILYINWDTESKTAVLEVIKKNDVYYGNENDDDIQKQPYILIRKRMPQNEAIDLARSLGMSADKEEYIIPDSDTFEESGEAAKDEVDDMVTVVYKFYRQKGVVHCAIATRLAEIVADKSMGIDLYPICHIVWEEKEGSARGEGEVRRLIPNQIEVNKTEMRRALTVKSQAYPLKVVDKNKVSNPEAVGRVGAVIETKGNSVDDVRKILGTIPPAQMSPDVAQLENDLIQMSRELAGAGEFATGQTKPTGASGRAILAVQQASEQPMTFQREAYKMLVEDAARIMLAYLIAHSAKGVQLEEEVKDASGQVFVQVVTVPQSVLKRIRATVKVDVTPKSAFDKFAQEQTLENYLVAGMFDPQKLPQLKAYAKVLDDDSVTPKLKLLEVIEEVENAQRQIAQIQQQAKLMQQRAMQFISQDPSAQASQLVDAQRQVGMQNAKAQMTA